MWKLWLDDQMNDPETPDRHVPIDFIGAASSEEAKKLVERLGPPILMDLDHDLGGEDTAMVFLKWLYQNGFNPPDYRVHSKNGEGRKNIISYLESWKKVIGE